MSLAQPYSETELFPLGPQKTYRGGELLQIAMPMGGIGAGSVCLNGYGGLQNFALHNRPATSAQADRHAFTEAAFALLHIKGDTPQTRLVEGPMPPEKIYSQGLKAQGFREGGHEGLPRFQECAFQGGYPFGQVMLSDPDLPLTVELTGYNPFIPGDDKASGLPCAILQYTLRNTSDQPVEFAFSYHLSHLAVGDSPRQSEDSFNAVIPGKGIYFYNQADPNCPEFGSASLSVIEHEPQIKAMWFRGGWFDAISALWREISAGQFKPNEGHVSGLKRGRNGGSILMPGRLEPGASITYPILLTWYFPNAQTTYGPVEPEPCDGSDGCCPPPWRPYYTSQWHDARHVALYVHENYPALYERTRAFHEAFFATSLPPYVLEAVSANLAIIKSPTVLRQANGNLWAWEGCFVDQGCCPGSCTHVWNYAQAIPHLFPQLERTLREQEYLRSMDEHGHVTFRASLPDGPSRHDFHAAADGQLGGIMKLHRDWQISGDTDWLRDLYPYAKRSLDWAIETWDPRRRGVLEEPHHNTYDIEFWGPDGMCSSIYLGALAAMAAMAEALNKPDDARAYRELAERGARYLDEHLFNGEYYQQHVTYEGLRDTSFAEFVAAVNETSSEEDQLLKAEGPKYQYGSGCLSDGVIGAWMADLYGIDTPQTAANVTRNLQAIFQHNFRSSLWQHANSQRPGYALGHEAGLLVCSWPHGGKPTLPFVYSDEVWTGMEYQVASHLILHGLVKEGLTLVKAARSRYDGHVRNPWDEYECGSYYARAMASYAVLIALSGFHYSAVTRTMSLKPQWPGRPLTTFFATATGYGTLTLSDTSLTINLVEGELALNAVHLAFAEQTLTLPVDQSVAAGEPLTLSLA